MNTINAMHDTTDTMNILGMVGMMGTLIVPDTIHMTNAMNAIDGGYNGYNMTGKMGTMNTMLTYYASLCFQDLNSLLPFMNLQQRHLHEPTHRRVSKEKIMSKWCPGPSSYSCNSLSLNTGTSTRILEYMY